LKNLSEEIFANKGQNRKIIFIFHKESSSLKVNGKTF